MLKLRIYLTFILIALLATSCGFVEDDPVKDSRILIVDDLTSTCTIDTDRMKNMFTENIQADLECVESTLEKFKYVRTVNQDILTEADIVRFVRKYFSNPQDTVDALSLLFKFNTLLLKDEIGEMKRENIAPFFDILIAINFHGVEMFNLVELMQDEKVPAQFKLLRSKLERSVNVFSLKITSIMNRGTGRTQKINVENLIIDLTRNLDEFELGRELLNSLLFVKKLFLGGPREHINTIEAHRLFNLFPVFAMNVFDIFLSNKEVAGSEGNYYEQIAKNLEELKKYVYEHQNEEFILAIGDLDNIIDEFFDEGGDDTFFKFLSDPSDSTAAELKRVIRSFKRDLVGGNKTLFTYRDVEASLAFINVGIRSFEKISKITDIVKEITEDDATDELKLRKKGEFITHLKALGKKGQELIEGNQDLPKSIKLLKFVQSLAEETGYLDLDPQLINSLFSIKVASVGGEREVATMDELIETLKKLEDFGILYYDLQFLTKYYSNLSEKSKFEFFRDEVQLLTGLLLKESQEQNVITIADLEVIIDQFFKETPDDRQNGEALKALITNFKTNILRSSRDALNFDQLKTSLDVTVIAYKAMVFMKYHEELKELVENGKVDKGIAKIKYRQEYVGMMKDLKAFLDDPIFLSEDIDLYSFIEDLENSSPMVNLEIDLILKGLSFKSIVLGGNNSILTKTEIEHFANNGSYISDIIFDLTFNDFGNIEPKADLYTLMLDILRNTRAVLPRVFDKKIFTDLKSALGFGDDLILFLNKKSDEPKDESSLLMPSKLKRTIVDLSERLLDKVGRQRLSYPAPCQPDPVNLGKYICSQDDPPNSEEINLDITNVNIGKLLDIVDESFQSMLFAEVTYDYYERDGQLSPNTPVDLKPAPPLPRLKDKITDKMYVKLSTSFAHIAKKFRYFRNKENYSFYDRRIHRNRTGFNSLVFLRATLGYALEAYGPENASGDPTKHDGLESQHLQDLLVGIKSVLEEIGLWTSNFESFGQNILLLADLFQSSSTGNLKINLDEASEFIELLLSASTLSDDIIGQLRDVTCSSSATYDEDGDVKIPTKCVRENFFKVMFGAPLKLGKYFPKLLEYVESAGEAQSIAYIKGVEGFARDVPDLNMPWEKRDFTLVIGAMLNIESTFLRFDKSYDNILNFKELKSALAVYNDAIILLAGLEGSQKKLSRTVFYYMAKYKKIPKPISVWALDKIFKIHFKKIKAERLNIGALLYNLVLAGGKKMSAQAKPESVTKLDTVGNLLGAYTDALTKKSGEEVEKIFDSAVETYEDTKSYLGF